MVPTDPGSTDLYEDRPHRRPAGTIGWLLATMVVVAVPLGAWSVAGFLREPPTAPWVLLAVIVAVASRAAVPFLTVRGMSDRERCGHGVVVPAALTLLPTGTFVTAAVLGVGLGWVARRLPVLTTVQPARRNSEIAAVLCRTTAAAAAAAWVAHAGWWSGSGTVLASMAGAVVFVVVDAVLASIVVAVVERRSPVEVMTSGLTTLLPIESIALACGLFVVFVAASDGAAPVWILLAATVALALAHNVSATDHARARYQSLVQLATSADAVASPEQTEEVVVDTVRDLVHAGRGELREHPPDEDEIGVALPMDGTPTWLVVGDRRGMARQFTVQDRQLLTAAGPLAAAAIRDAVERQGLSTMLGTDALTGLGNRRALDDGAPRRIAEDRRRRRHTAVVVLDIDDFKPVNDDLGHDVGDDVLVDIAQRLQASARERDVLVRLGGDEFAVVASDLPSRPVADDVADRIRDQLDGVTAADGRAVRVSMGLAVAPDDGTSLHALLRAADRRMYDDKRANAPS